MALMCSMSMMRWVSDKGGAGRAKPAILARRGACFALLKSAQKRSQVCRQRRRLLVVQHVAAGA
jgi:hypothetical protein